MNIFLAMKQYLKLFLKSKFILILLILTFFAVKPLLHPGLPPTHDGENHVIRVYLFDKALRDGDVYPRWASELNHGYGVPLFNYVYPMPNYFGALFHTFGASFIDAFKLNLLVATVVGVVFFYLWTRLFMGNAAALTAAVFYSFAPYRFVDMYVRGSVGEVWALAFFPAFLWSVTKLFEKGLSAGRQGNISYVVLSSIFLAGTIFSHNILALMCMVFGTTYAAFLIWQAKNRKFFLHLTSYIFILSLSLSAVFWLPALVEKEYAQGLQIYGVDANFPELFQLLIPSWGTGFSGGSLQDQMSFQIGVANLFVVFIGFIFLLGGILKKSSSRKRGSNIAKRESLEHDSSVALSSNKKLLLFFLGWFALVFYLMLGVSKPLWHMIPLLDYFQFPWRFLSLMIIICSFIAGIVIEMITGKKKRVVFAVLFIVFTIVTTISYTQPAYYHNRTDEHYLTRDNFIHGNNSPGDVFNTKWMNAKLPLKKERVEVLSGIAKITVLESKTSAHRFHVESAKESTLVANIAYFPGWTLRVDSKEAELKKTKDGLMEFPIPKGTHTVELRFNDTMVRRMASVISLAALLICAGLVWMKRKRED